MLKIARLALIAASLLGFATAAIAQPAGGNPGGGPVPPPSPWLYAAPLIYAPAGSCIGLPQTVTGGCVTGNSINISGNYYRNGVAQDFITSASPPLAFSGGVLSLNINSSLALDGFNNLGINLANPNNWTAPQTELINQNAATGWRASNNSAGTAALADFNATNGTGNASFGISGTGYTGTFGLSNYAFVFGDAGVAGIVIDNAGANPIIFGVANLEVARLTAAEFRPVDAAVALGDGTHRFTNEYLSGGIALGSSTVAPAAGINGGGSGSWTLNAGGAVIATLAQSPFSFTVNSASFGLSGNISTTAWTTNGVRYANVPSTLTDTTSSGTVATAYTDVWGGNTIAASSAVTFTNYYGGYFKAPTAGTNVTITNKYALGADSANLLALTLTLGSDATGDTYYRSAGNVLTRRGIGPAGNVYIVQAGVPTWLSFANACTAATISVLGCVQSDNATLSINGSGVISINLANANIWTATQTINPASGTNNQGFSVTQTLLSSAGQTGPIIANNIKVTTAGSVTSPALGSGCSSGCTNGMADAETRALYVELNDSGSSVVSAAIAGHMVVNTGTPANDKVAVLGNAYANVSLNAYLNAGDFESFVGPSGSVVFLVGAQFGTGIFSGGSATNRIGVNVIAENVGQATGFDAAFSIANIGGSGAAYKKGFSIGDPSSAFAPLDAAGDVIYVQQAQTVANFCNCSNLTMTGGVPINFGNSFFIANLNNQNALTQFALANNNGGSATAIEASYSNGTNSFTVGLGGTALTGAYQNAGFATANGTSPLIVGTTGNAIVQFFQNNAEAMRINTSKQLGIGTTNPQSLLTVSANATATPSVAPLAGTNLWLVGVNGTGANNGITLDQYGGQNLGNNDFSQRQARGTAASPTASASGDTLGQFRFWGYGTSFYRTAALFVTANETFSGTAGGADLAWYLTPNTTQSLTQSVTFKASGGLVVGAVATDPGIGSLYLNGQMFVPNITTSSAAQTGTVCWTTSTGKFTVDTTVGCLTSILSAKNIDSHISGDEALRIVGALDLVSFHYKAGWGDSGHYAQFGLIAEEVAAIDERLVGRDPEGRLQGVRYQEMTAVLAGAIKELKADNDNLRAEVETLRRGRL